ncbi:MAG: YdeI/OmpD-associated family protein [Sphingobacteriales bacterium]|nr:YdeI/OmpD-associated family protein [Sphingobacteriales bacterium]
MEDVLVRSQTILEKLAIQDEKNLLIQGLPSTIEKQFIKLTFAKSITPLLKARKIDFALVFAISQNQLKDILKDVTPALNDSAKLWIGYPKASSKIVSDLSRVNDWSCIESLGFEQEHIIVLDNVWSAIRFKKAAKEKTVAQVSIKMNPVKEIEEGDCPKTITAPPDLIKLFTKNKKAKDFFENLSVSNKKEYVTWITGTKKEEIKLARLEATIEKLKNGKCTPSEK